jgi:hypothetical protein
LTTRETVAGETPACLATSLIVAMGGSSCLPLLLCWGLAQAVYVNGCVIRLTQRVQG